MGSCSKQSPITSGWVLLLMPKPGQRLEIFQTPNQRPVLPQFRPSQMPVLSELHTCLGTLLKGQAARRNQLLQSLKWLIFKRSQPRHHPRIRVPSRPSPTWLRFLLMMNSFFERHIAAVSNSCKNKYHSEPKAAMLWISTRRACPLSCRICSLCCIIMRIF